MARTISSFFFAILLLIVFSFQAYAQQRFGTAIVVSQDEILIGEPDNDYQPGTVYVYARQSDSWSQVDEIVAPEAEMGDHFGRSLSLWGDQLLIGSTGLDGEVGAAYVYERNDDGRWRHVHTMTPSDAVAEDGFGAAVALTDGHAFIGAPSPDGGPGAVYVFSRDEEGSWTQAAKLNGSEAAEGAGFGRAIAVAEAGLFIGAPGQNGGGAVYMYANNDGSWSESGILRARLISDGARLGSALEIEDNMILAGAPRHGGAVGAVVVFEWNSDRRTWIDSVILQPYAASLFHGFGASVAADGGNVFVGSPTADSFVGTVYTFNHQENAWSAVHRLQPENASQRDMAGAAIDVAGSIAAVGLAGADYGAGTVILFERTDDGWMETAELKSENTGLPAVVGSRVDCRQGSANIFDCSAVNLLSFLPIADIGGDRGVELNDIWGWTDPETDREYALVGRVDGTSFVDVTDPINPIYVGNLWRTKGSPGSSWRDIKVYRDHAFIVADGAGEHGMQIFDLTELRGFDGTPLTFEVTAHYDRIHSAHNVVIDTESGFAYTVGNSDGGETCGGGLHMIDIQNPTSPEFAGCFADPSTGRAGTGYTHDAQCLVYRGPDTKYTGRQICFGSNETALSIADVTDKANPVAIAAASYPNVSYTHQGWITEDHRYFYVNDELDELSGNVPETRTLIWDVTDLEDPQLVKEYMWGVESSDHNLYIRDNLMYQSNYTSGLRIHDISDPENPVEVGYFDTMPVGENTPGFSGSWSNYPFFESGTIAVSSIGEGLFLLRKADEPGL